MSSKLGDSFLNTRRLRRLDFLDVMPLTASIRRRPSRSWTVRALVYCVPLLSFLYGLKCIVTLSGTLTVGRTTVMRSFYLVQVHGTAALLTGLGYVALGIFAALCTGDPPPERRHWSWRVLRGASRWGSLIAMFWFWQRACKLLGVGVPWPTLNSQDDFQALALVAMCFGIVAVLCFLFAMFHRESVKRELAENGCTPVHIWWRPAAYWAPFLNSGAPFRVIYRDPRGTLHKAYCSTYRSLLGSPWGPRRVLWLKDEVAEAAPPPESWVFVDGLPVRPQLESSGAPAPRENFLLESPDQQQDSR